jgi:hypothetical protein
MQGALDPAAAGPSRPSSSGSASARDFDAERARVAAALAAKQVRRFEGRAIAWKCPEHEIGAKAAKPACRRHHPRLPSGRPPQEPARRRLTRSPRARGPDADRRRRRCRNHRDRLVAATAANRPATSRTCRPTSPIPPTSPIGHVRSPQPTTDRGRDPWSAELEREGMGGLPRRRGRLHKDCADRSPLLRRGGSQGDRSSASSAATPLFDTGGISLKPRPARARHEERARTGGGAAVLEATAAIAELGLAVDRDFGPPGTSRTCRAEALPAPATSSPSSTASPSRSTTPTPRAL